MTLEQWSQRLLRHFESLAGSRASSGQQIFALEHSLNDTEIEELSSLLRAELEGDGPLSAHWLLWVIYASERGYAYAGDEYWPSFEAQTPRWEVDDRYKLARYFKKFRDAFGGVVPCGRWAEHFAIISWPITHAVLPRYLQRQFAKRLYELRHSLIALRAPTPGDVGRLLATNANHTSARFQVFLQQEVLAGQIALALLDIEPAIGEEIIYEPTLRRIISDLEKVRSARDWLRETRYVVKDRFKGIGDGRLGGIQGGRWRAAPTDLLIRPSIRLRHRGEGTWAVGLDIPSFQKVAALSASVRSFLMATRCRLNGANDVKPAGWLLSGNRRALLKRWPDVEKPLIQFEAPNNELDQLLEAECRLDRGPTWLFRIAGDGTAREIAGRIVRPGSRYVVVTTKEKPTLHTQMGYCRLDCVGIRAYRLEVPLYVPTEDVAWLSRLGLQVARTVRVWPGGLSARGWDGEGHGEWLTTEAPCFGIMHDHAVDEYVLRLDDGPEMAVKAGEQTMPVFVRIAPLPAGKHRLTVQARRSAMLEKTVATPAAEGFVQLHVREPAPWIPGTVSHTGLLATLDPHDADLDSLWKNEVSLSVQGPENHSVAVTVSLRDKDGRTILSKEIGGDMGLPVTRDEWSRTFSQFLEREEKVNAWRYLEAASGQLDIKGEELGEFSFRFEHDVLPLRWALRRDQENIAVRLVDDTGDETSRLQIRFFSMSRPFKAERVSPDEALFWRGVDPAGGLFYAKQGHHRDAVVVIPGRRMGGLQSLVVESDFRDVREGLVGVGYALRLYSRWREARVYGSLGNVRKEHLLEGFRDNLYERLCGRNWARVEAAFRNARDRPHALNILQGAVAPRWPGFATCLRREYLQMNDDYDRASQWYSDVTARYHVRSSQKLCDFALKLASQPDQLSDMEGKEPNEMLSAILRNPTILRGARLLAILRANGADL